VCRRRTRQSYRTRTPTSRPRRTAVEGRRTGGGNQGSRRPPLGGSPRPTGLRESVEGGPRAAAAPRRPASPLLRRPHLTVGGTPPIGVIHDVGCRRGSRPVARRQLGTETGPVGRRSTRSVTRVVASTFWRPLAGGVRVSGTAMRTMARYAGRSRASRSTWHRCNGMPATILGPSWWSCQRHQLHGSVGRG
jgi:hypothetical protein